VGVAFIGEFALAGISKAPTATPLTAGLRSPSQ
jgi:hypothetical protein